MERPSLARRSRVTCGMPIGAGAKPSSGLGLAMDQYMVGLGIDGWYLRAQKMGTEIN